MDDDPAWRLLDPGELVHIGPTLHVSSHMILDGPPARLLKLEDLGARARASQERVPV